jgi:hypothetical protein
MTPIPQIIIMLLLLLLLSSVSGKIHFPSHPVTVEMGKKNRLTAISF